MEPSTRYWPSPQIHQLLFLILVILIADIAHDFFQYILQGNQTCRGAVLIQNNNDIVGRLFISIISSDSFLDSKV